MFDSLWQTYLPLLYSWTTWKWWTCRKRNYCKSFQKHWHTGRFIFNNFIIPDEFLFYCPVVPWKGQTARTGWLDCSFWKGNNNYTLLLEQKPCQKHWHTGRFIFNNFIIPDEFLFYCPVVPWKGQTARTGWLDCSFWKGNNNYTLLREQKPFQKHWHTGRFIFNNFIIPDEFLFYCPVVPWKGQTARTGWLDCSFWKGNNNYTLLLEQKPILAVQITSGLQCILCKLTWLALNCVQKCHNGKNGESGAKLPEALQKFKCDY